MSTRAADRAALSAGKRALLEKMMAGKVPASRPSGIPRRVDQGPAPLSFAQQRLWFIHQIDPSSPAYNVPCALRLWGALDRPRLERCLDELLRRHDSLRTSFETWSEGPVQIVEADARLDLTWTDLKPLDPEAREAEVRRLAAAEAALPFDLTRAPLMRVRVHRLAPDDHLFLLTLHHIVSDGWSMGVLVREIATLYEAFGAGGPSPLPSLPIQYADFAVWQRDRLQGERLERELAYWKERLTPLPAALELP
ncbi:MAG: condensation domain-containing protein, partial [Candidatus Polarisedimenticolia bacterium]